MAEMIHVRSESSGIRRPKGIKNIPDASRRRVILYWVCQISGWGLFVLGNVLMAAFDSQPNMELAVVSVLTMFTGIILTHALRLVIHRGKWTGFSLSALLPRILISSVVLGIVFVVVNSILSELIIGDELFHSFKVWKVFLLNALNFSVVFLIWEMIYFAFKTFQSWKQEEINNLELRAAKTEIELNSFKSQLNPHFIFNSLNSIRALVDEDPDRAKRAITMLSGILRNNLMLGKRQTVLLSEELDLVEKYLSMEKIRFEERLTLDIQIDEACLSCEVPPFMIQTLVENGIKHGISRRTEGGIVRLAARMESDKLAIDILNTGHYKPVSGQEGIGIANTRQRLELIYGPESSFSVVNEDDLVHARLEIPQHIRQL